MGTSTPTLILIIVGIIAVIVATLVMLYVLILVRRTNIVMKKIDYLVEDFTYKSESLNVAVDVITKMSNYALTLDVLSKKSIKSAFKFVGENRNYFYSFIDKMKVIVSERSTDAKKKSTSTTKKPATKGKTTTAKKPAAKATTKPVAKKPVAKKSPTKAASKPSTTPKKNKGE